MAKKADQTLPGSERGTLYRELAGVVLFVAAVFLLVALTSFADKESTNARGSAANLCGDSGYIIARAALFWFGYVPFADAGFLTEGEVIPFDPGTAYDDCLEDITQISALCGRLEKDLVVVDLTDPDVGFPVVQVIIPGYSDILPFHPASSRVLFEGWTRRLPMGYIEDGSAAPRPVDAGGLFPGW